MCIRDRDDPGESQGSGGAAGGQERADLVRGAQPLAGGADPVSYTHLTLPTSDLV